MTIRIVSLTGSDSNSGTSELSPLRTPGKGLSLTQPGDTLYFRGGIWPDRISSQSHVIRSGSSWADAPVIAAYPSETVTFRPTSGDGPVMYLLYGSTKYQYIRFERLIVDGNHIVKFGFSFDGYNYATNIHHIRVKDCEVKNTNFSGLLSGRGANFLEILNMHAHHCGLDNQYDHGMYLQSSDCLVEGGEFNNNASAGIQIYTGLNGMTDRCHRNIVRGAKLHHNRFGLILGSGDTNQGYNNLVYRNTLEGIKTGFTGGVNTKIYNNTIAFNGGNGIEVRSGITGVKVRNNISVSNGNNLLDLGSGTTKTNNITSGDPLFVNAAADDYRLQAGSPAINAGMTVAEVPTDYDRNARPNGTTYDIGAYEFGGSPAPVPPPTVPSAPSGLTVTPISASALRVDWTDNASNESGYEIERSASGTGGWVKRTTTLANVTSWTDTGLGAGETWHYRARGINAAGPSAYSNTDSDTTQSAPVVVPAAPSSLAATALTATSIGVTWTRNATNETSVELERSPAPGSSYAPLITLGAGVTSYIDSGLDPATQYFYRVRNVNIVGPSAYSNSDDATTLAAPGAAPDAPTALELVVVSHRQIDQSWATATGDPDGYVIKRSEDGTTFEDIDLVVGALSTYYSDRTCRENTTYFYQIFAYNESGESLVGSNIASATTPDFDNLTFTEDQLLSLLGIAPGPNSDDTTVEHWLHMAGQYRGPFDLLQIRLDPPDPGIGIITLWDVHTHLEVNDLPGPFLYSTFEPPTGANEYHARLLGNVSITKELPDPYNGIPGVREATVEMSNLDVDPERPTLSEIATVEDPIGIYAPVVVRDLGIRSDPAGTVGPRDLMRLDGKITSYQPGIATATATVSIDEPKVMETLVPRKRVAEVFPDLDLTTFKSQDPCVLVVLGPWKKVQLGLCQTDGSTYWDYGPVRKPTAGVVSFVNGYRAGAYIQPDEYTIVEPEPGFLCVRFTLDQTDRGQPLAIQFDLNTTEFTRNPARAIKFLLSDTTYGVGQGVNADSFAEAGVVYATIPMRIGGGLSEQQELRVVLRDWLLHGAYLDREHLTGDYTITVDTLDLHPLHEARNFQLGFGTTDWHNIPNDPSESVQNETQRLRELVLESGWDPYFNGQGSYHIHTKRTRTNPATGQEIPGKAEQRQNRFIVDTSTADRQTHYLWHRTNVRDHQFAIEGIGETYVLDIGHRVLTTIPTMQLDGTEMEVIRRTFNGGTDAAFSYLITPWDVQAFTYVPEIIEESPYADLLIDYRRTPPSMPTNFVVDRAIVRSDPNTGLVESIVRLRASHATENITHMHFVALRPGEDVIVKEIEQPVNLTTPNPDGSFTVYGEISLHAGLGYDFEAYAVNKNNDFDRQESERATITDYTAPGDTDKPAPPTHLNATRGTGRNVYLTWDASTDHIKIREYWLERSTDPTFATGATIVAKVKTTQFQDTNVLYDSEQYYHAKAVSRSDIHSDWSNSVVMKVVRLQPSDYGDETQYRVHRAPLSQIVYIVTVPANSAFAFSTGIDAKKYEWQAGMLGQQATPSWNGTTPGVGPIIDGTRDFAFQAGGGVSGPFSADFDAGVWNGTAEEFVTVIQASGS